MTALPDTIRQIEVEAAKRGGNYPDMIYAPTGDIDDWTRECGHKPPRERITHLRGVPLIDTGPEGLFMLAWVVATHTYDAA